MTALHPYYLTRTDAALGALHRKCPCKKVRFGLAHYSAQPNGRQFDIAQLAHWDGCVYAQASGFTSGSGFGMITAPRGRSARASITWLL